MRADLVAELLPEVFRRSRQPGGVLDAVLGAMEAMHAPVEAVLADFDAFVDPYRCPARFVPYLAEWVGLGWLLPPEDRDGTISTGDGPLRDLVAHAEALAKARGTAAGLARFLRLATGSEGFAVVDDPDEPFHVRVVAPEAARRHQELVERIVLHEKPVFTTAELVLGDDPPRHLGRVPPRPRRQPRRRGPTPDGLLPTRPPGEDDDA